MTTRLTLIPYLQGWDGSNLTIRLLALPRGSPIDQLVPPSPTSFATANFKFDVHILTDINTLPQPGGTTFTTVPSSAPPQGLALFNALALQFPIDPTTPTGAGSKPPGSVVKKHLPLSYQNAVNYTRGQSSALVYTDDTYSCMMGQHTGHYTHLPPPNPKYAWGRVIAMLLRNSTLAQTAGLIRPFTINFPDPTTLKNGGYIYLTLSSTSDASGLLQGDGLKAYASRIPPLSSARDLFSPEFFPVVTPVPTANYADIFAEVEDYDDGWAKAVHCYQVQQLDTLSETPDGTRPSKDLGVRIGWDDVQVTIWMNRQLDETQDFDSPLGVQGYRVDARVQGTTEWFSLVHASGPIVVQGLNPIQFDGELNVEVHPVQQYAQKQGDFWLPTYFTTWIGRSVVTTDETVPLLMGGPDLSKLPKVRGTTPRVNLRYGTNYQFRVRLADHTGGGPTSLGNPSVPGPQPIANINFRRWIRPMSPTLTSPASSSIPATPDFSNPPAFLELQRPLLHYPAVVFTGHYPNAIQDLINDVPNAIDQKREPGLVDPDVVSVKITVEVAGLLQDPTATDGGYVPLFDTFRSFPTGLDATLHIDIQWQDFQQVANLEAAEPSTGPLLLPTARNIRLRIVAACNPIAGYYGAEDVMYGPSVMLELGKYSSSEAAIFVPALPAQAITAFFFQPDTPTDSNVATAQQAAGNAGQAPSDIATRAAAAFGLPNEGLALYAPPGRRTVFGCAGAFNHTISPNLSSITFTSNHDLALHWIVVIRLTINRDWTWNGFVPNGISVQRDGVEVGSFAPNQNVDKTILANPDRTGTNLIFFDVIDPKVPTGSFPQELNPDYKIVCSFQGSPTADAPQEFTIRLPVTTTPLQVPKLVSAGIAMSPYAHPPNYSSTTPRTRSLWLEFDSAPADSRDQYFARVLRNVPDPLLSSLGNTIPVTLEPPLPVDPEPVQKIVPGEATDEDGLAVMQPLIASDSPVHFILPLPPGTTNTSPELFGFWTYELRLGHVGMWCTAQGRFGPPLRVAGVQHPPPTLVCSALRTKTSITVTAPFAVPVLGGVVTQPPPPRSTMWALLYAQAARLDGSGEWSNVLIERAQMMPVFEYPTKQPVRFPPTQCGSGSFLVSDYLQILLSLGFDADAPLSVLAVEMMPQDEILADPLGADLGGQRILRSSGLVSVPVIC
jgi:hypothetical protein